MNKITEIMKKQCEAKPLTNKELLKQFKKEQRIKEIKEALKENVKMFIVGVLSTTGVISQSLNAFGYYFDECARDAIKDLIKDGVIEEDNKYLLHYHLRCKSE